jgi:allophanate hydrolase subunit 2
LAPGSVQVPGNGLPIVLLADRGTTGGYPKIATVISADIPALGRRRAGQTIRFAAVDVASAEKIRREQDQALRSLLADARPVPAAASLSISALYDLNLISGMVDAGRE